MTNMDSETCAQCGFDTTEWNDQDTVSTIRAAHRLVGFWIERVDDVDYNRRPSDEVWSIGEYINHIRETMFAMRLVQSAANADSGIDLGAKIEPASAGQPKTFDRERSCQELKAEVGAFSALLAQLDETAWDDHVVLGGDKRSAQWASRHAVHDLWHHLIDISDVRAAIGDGVVAQLGVLSQISVSPGGVPKNPVASASVGRRGVEGDSQAARVHHGRPWQAVCLWSSDVIETLIGEGHPIFAGACGENLTLSGIDWAKMRPGVVVEIGDVVIRVSAPSEPCSKNAQWFIDGEISRIHHDRNRGSSRWYGSVEQTGSIRAGDSVTLR
jgi:MOSC domain-containing protein YiiM